jgi:hypothetical protein
VTRSSPDALVIVYNADEGIGAALIDAAHKILRPDTYRCDLCAITYGAVSMRGAWKQWLAAQPFRVEFFHRQDFSRAFPTLAVMPLPAVLRRDGDELALLIGPEDIRADMGVDALIAAIEVRL